MNYHNILIFLIFWQVFRPRIMCVEFIKNLATLLSHVKSIETGETNIEAANGRLFILFFFY